MFLQPHSHLFPPHTKFWVFPAKSRSCALTSQSWRFWWRRSMTWLSLGLATQRCPTWSRSLCRCCVTICHAGGRGALRTSLSRKVRSAPLSPQSISTSCWGASWKSLWTTWVSMRPRGWRDWQVSRRFALSHDAFWGVWDILWLSEWSKSKANVANMLFPAIYWWQLMSVYSSVCPAHC